MALARLIGVGLVASVVVSSGFTQTLVETGFEDFEFGDPHLQLGWEANGAASASAPPDTLIGLIQNDVRHTGTKAVRIDTYYVSSGYFLWKLFAPVTGDLLVTTAWLQFDDAAMYDPPFANSAFGLDAFASNGSRVGTVAIGPDGAPYLRGDSATPVKSTLPPLAFDTWHRVTLVVNKADNVVTAFVNGARVAPSQPFTDSDVVEVDIAAYGFGATSRAFGVSSAGGFNSGIFDDYRVTQTPLGTVQSQVTLADYSASPAAWPVTVDLMVPGTQTSVAQYPATLDADGRFSVVVTERGTFDLVIKSGHWLSARSANEVITNDGRFDLDLTLENGDIDGDNAVTVFDYDYLSVSFDKSSTDGDWNTPDEAGIPPRFSDLDGDDAVTVFDYDILSKNFDLVGE